MSNEYVWTNEQAWMDGFQRNAAAVCFQSSGRSARGSVPEHVESATSLACLSLRRLHSRPIGHMYCIPAGLPAAKVRPPLCGGTGVDLRDGGTRAQVIAREEFAAVSRLTQTMTTTTPRDEICSFVKSRGRCYRWLYWKRAAPAV